MAKPKRPRDFMQRAKMIVDIATGETTDKPEENKNQIKGAKGGKVRAGNLTPERRKEIAKIAADKRWGKK